MENGQAEPKAEGMEIDERVKEETNVSLQEDRQSDDKLPTEGQKPSEPDPSPSQTEPNEEWRIFHVLDEYVHSENEGDVKDEEEDDGMHEDDNEGRKDLDDMVGGAFGDTSASVDGYSSESDISDNEIEAMLEEGLEVNKGPVKGTPKVAKLKGHEEVQYREHKITTLEELFHNHFDMLPEGWIQINHRSGMPLYLHKQSRVCTFSRPYYLGHASARKHRVPLSAIPCLQYKRALEEEKRQEEKVKQEREQAAEAAAVTAAASGQSDVPANASAPLQPGAPIPGQLPLRTARIETAEENKLFQSLSAFSIQQYCKSLFRFKTTQRLRFVTWLDRRRYAKAKRMEKKQQRPTFPDDTKLIKFPIQNFDDGPDAKPRGEWIMNPNGKSYICILHEYVQHALKKQPTYEFKALENPSTPYSATVIINGMRYGYGTGTSKKQAKLAAAKASLEILIPEMREKIRNDSKTGPGGTKRPLEDEEASLSIFDAIKIEDPRVAEFCAKTTEPSPFSILLTCLQRNFDTKEMPIDYKVNPLHRQANEFIMTVGSHKARVVCKNKKEGKQRASQAILQELHPHIKSWGSLLRLYGNSSMRNVKEKKQEEQEITMLQSKASLNSPNYAILGKLKAEMMKLNEEKSKRKPIGVFIPPSDISLPMSGTQLSKIQL